MLARFKKSLGESSKIISQSRLSNSLHRELNILQGFERSPEAEREYIDKSSLNHTYRNSHDHNKLIKKIPELISQNDQLKEKIRKMEEQIAAIVQAQKKRPSFSFRRENEKQDEDMVVSSIHKPRASRLEETSHKRTNTFSLDHYLAQVDNRHKYQQNHYSRFQKESNIDIESLKEKIHRLQSEISKLGQQNRDLKRQNNKIMALKHESARQIDRIVAKFEQTLKNKEEVIKVQVVLMQQKIARLKRQNEVIQKEKNKVLQECLHMKKTLQRQVNNEQAKLQMVQTDYQERQLRERQAYKLNEAIEHLWTVKDAQINNLITTLRFAKLDLR